jgi:hypothetical protein
MPASEPLPNLVCHPHHPASMVRAVQATATRAPDGGLVFFYQISGDMVRLRIPAPRAQGRSDGLWEHTCCEAFVAIAGDPAYREFNFSPSGEWAAYAFSGYRRLQDKHAAAAPPRISAKVSEGRLELNATLAAGSLPPGAGTATLQIGLAVVIESADTAAGERSYWALRHAAETADFHRRESFVLALPPVKETPCPA